jgi:hypothetical protein
MSFEAKVSFGYYQVGCSERLLTTYRIKSERRSEVSAKYALEENINYVTLAAEPVGFNGTLYV